MCKFKGGCNGGRWWSDLNPMKNDRWSEPGNDTFYYDGIKNGDEYDYYEPYRGYKRSIENEIVQIASSHGSLDRESSQGKKTQRALCWW